MNGTKTGKTITDHAGDQVSVRKSYDGAKTIVRVQELAVGAEVHLSDAQVRELRAGLSEAIGEAVHVLGDAEAGPEGYVVTCSCGYATTPNASADRAVRDAVAHKAAREAAGS